MTFYSFVKLFDGSEESGVFSSRAWGSSPKVKEHEKPVFQVLDLWLRRFLGSQGICFAPVSPVGVHPFLESNPAWSTHFPIIDSTHYCPVKIFMTAISAR